VLLGERLDEEAERAGQQCGHDQRTPDRLAAWDLQVAGQRGDREADRPAHRQLHGDQSTHVVVLDGAGRGQDVRGEGDGAQQHEPVAAQPEVAAGAGKQVEAER
jgi:hypothetical protein